MLRSSALIALLLSASACVIKQGESPDADTAVETEDTDVVIENDSDGDNILDIHEGIGDSDGDGTPDYLDDDSDGDGIPDAIEGGDSDPETFPTDSDVDGVSDFLDDDSDDNGISDAEEAGPDPTNPSDADADGDPDYRDDDNDGDNILDVWEMDFDAEAPPDTDRDNVPDYLDTDSDNDTLCDIWEGGTTSFREEPIDTDEDLSYDYRDLDSDDDGYSDMDEARVSEVCAEPADLDGDGRYNSADLDSDGDGLTDVEEDTFYNTDPYDRDTDGDSQSDGAEVAAETDPRNPADNIEGIYVEVDERTTVEKTFPFDLKLQYGDIAFILDTTCSMSSTLQAAASQFADVAVELEGTFENLAFGVATFDDYACCGYGTAGVDKPFILQQQISDDVGDSQSALNGLSIHSGNDTQESDMEALYQAITGEGYDMDCDRSYDSSTDVPPFLASASDAFQGSAPSAGSAGGDGTIGGMGFRDFSLPILFYATDYYIRDPDSADPQLASTPGGCPLDAGSTAVTSALAGIGGYVVGVDVGPAGPESSTSPYAQMEALAFATNSVADLDEDGDSNDPLVFSASQSGADFEDEFREKVVLAVEQLVARLEWDKVELLVQGDEYGMIESIEPEYYEDIDPDEVDTLEFTLSFTGTVAASEDDQHFRMTLNVVADSNILLDTYDIIVVIPGSSY